MELNLTDIVKSDGSEKRFSDKLSLEPVKYMGLEVRFDEDVFVEGCVKNVSGVLELDMKISCKIFTQCARCLESVERELCENVRETLLQEGEEGLDNNDNDGDVIVFSGYLLPLDEIVLNAILVSMDVRYLCSEDCKGLCPVCGKNLNVESCDCKSDIVDPRFEVLSKLI